MIRLLDKLKRFLSKPAAAPARVEPAACRLSEQAALDIAGKALGIGPLHVEEILKTDQGPRWVIAWGSRAKGQSVCIDDTSGEVISRGSWSSR